jgi:hypothetical protein
MCVCCVRSGARGREGRGGVPERGAAGREECVVNVVGLGVRGTEDSSTASF